MAAPAGQELGLREVQSCRDDPKAHPSSPQVKAKSGKMYPSLALAPSPGQATYADSGAFLHAPGAGSPVFVPPARVPSMLPYLPACEPGPQPSALAAHPGWVQAASADSSAFVSGSPHPPASQPAGATSFSFAHSPPGPGGGGGAGGRDGGAYHGALLARDPYPAPLGRPVGASYPTAYPAYVSTEVAPSWASGPFEGSVLHSLQGRPAGLPGRRATLGECGAGAAPLGPRPPRSATRTLRNAELSPPGAPSLGRQDPTVQRLPRPRRPAEPGP